jgi:uncharacterized repeat protein (TIGR03843 family)
MTSLDLLRHGRLTVEGRLRAASNTTLYCRLELDGVTGACVYKPSAGERPLWDFPTGTLAAREVAAFEVSEALRWHLVPATVLRDGPYGPGMCQAWVEATAADVVDVVPLGALRPGWRHVLDATDSSGTPVSLAHADLPELRRMALFDAVVNNADRKGGHVLRAAGGAVVGIDHGVTFHVEDKLRSVLWGWGGEPIDAAEADGLRRLTEALEGPLGGRLASLLSQAEARRTRRRARDLVRSGRFPRPTGAWPAIPWPVF